MSKAAKFTLTVLCALYFCGVGTVAAAAYSYRGKMYPNTLVAGVDVGNLSYLQSRTRIEQRANMLGDIPVSVMVTDVAKPMQQAGTTVRGLGVVFQVDTALVEAWQPTHTFSVEWPRQALRAFFGSTHIALPFTGKPQALTNFITEHVDPLVVTPVAAKLSVSGESVFITAAIPGVVVDRTELTGRLTAALSTVADGDALSLAAPTHEGNATVTEAMLQPLAERLNTLGDSRITLANGPFSLSPSRAQKLAWFTPFQDEQGTVSLKVDDAKVTAYLRAYQSVNAAASGTAIAKVLQEQLGANPSVVQSKLALIMNTPTVAVTGDVKLGLYPGKYIQINLVEQKLYRVNGQILEKVYPVSSGKASTPTPRGTFTLSGHALRPLSSLYGLYMPYWINFKDGAYGLHELPEWPNGYKEGQGHLGTPVSDGCVRLGIGDAKEIYNWTADGTPLLIQ